MEDYSVEVLKTRLMEAIERLMEHDRDLLVLNVSERCVSHRLALYLQELFPELNVDCEYNRNGPDTKQLKPPPIPFYWDDDESKSVFPDILVHRRNYPDRNVLVVEMKKTANGILANFDRAKLDAFTRPDYNYALGAFIVFQTGDDAKISSLEWFPEH